MSTDPAPAPAPAPRPREPFSRRDFLQTLAIFGLGLMVIWPAIKPYFPRTDPFYQAGKDYRSDTAITYATGWDTAANSLEAGKTVGDSQADFQAAWQKARNDAFNAKLCPQLAAVLPEGTEPISPTHRAQVVAAWRNLAKGLRAR